LSVCVIADVHPVDMVPDAIFSIKGVRSRSKINLENPSVLTGCKF